MVKLRREVKPPYIQRANSRTARQKRGELPLGQKYKKQVSLPKQSV